MKNILKSAAAVALLALAQSCHNDFENDVTKTAITSGDANFSKYVALGNSLTSGYRDGSLYQDGQKESYPSMLAAQMKFAGGGDFAQPLMEDNNGGLLLPTPIGNVQIQDTKLFISGFDVAGSPNIERANSGKSVNVLKSIFTAGNYYQNMGVPGARVAHLLAPGYGNPAGVAAKTANPYFVRFASSATTSVIADFLAQKPTFFSLWIGSNDALLYALAGADPSVEALTPAATFNTYYNALMAQIATSGAKGVVANIPYVTSIPSLTTFPYNPLTSSVLGKGNTTTGDATIDNLNTNLYGPLNQILTALGAADRIKPLSKTGANPMLINDESLTDLGANITAVASASANPTLKALAAYLGATYGKARQTTAADLIPLTTKAEVGAQVTLPAGIPATLGLRGVSFPMEDRFVLVPAEIKDINSTIDAYNTTIKNSAAAKGYAFVDANAKLTELNSASGIQWDGVRYTAKFVTGGAFSLDGVHLTGRGYAVIANEFLSAINKTYNARLPMVNPNAYSGVKFP